MELTGVRFCVLDTGRLKTFCDGASQNVRCNLQLKIGTFRAQVQADGQSLYVISVPWSQALRCTVDGQPVSVHRLADGLCAVEADRRRTQPGIGLDGARRNLGTVPFGCSSHNAGGSGSLAEKNKGGESHVHLPSSLRRA